MRKKGKQNTVYSPEYKRMAVEKLRSEKLSYHEAVRELCLGDHENGGARRMLQRWERIYLEEGAEGLMRERRGRASKNDWSQKRQTAKIRQGS